MSTDSNTAVNKLTTKDTEWAAKILEQAFYTDPMLSFIYGGSINKPGKLNWFLRVTFRLAALYGECLATAEKEGVLMASQYFHRDLLR
jgi:hypothetical protein